jgi:hypothetical protein
MNPFCSMSGSRPHNVLLWADGTPCYEIRNFSAPGGLMPFNVIRP